MDFSFWLIPEKNQKKFFQKIIDNLAQKYSSCSFIPHLTIYYIPPQNKKNLEIKTILKILKENFNSEEKINLQFSHLDFSDIFTKTLYCQMKTNQQLINLYDKFKKFFGNYSDYQLNPHLSLIYKNNMNVEDKKKEIKKLNSLIPKTIIFDKLSLIIRDKGHIKKETDVLDWKEIIEINLI
ncbi:MAG: hypothetical protein NZM02_01660 [Patescibacteria group bacterium]|nr:hypothetical protein [Patescibacteria group bacterium]